MTEFIVHTTIEAPVERCFHLSRSIDLHLDSMAESGEKAISGVTKGLSGLGEEVTWRAKHFGIWQNFTSKITAFDAPFRFVDEMQKGAFKSFWHEHRFEAKQGITLMTDTIRYQVPLGIIGGAFDKLILKNYMKGLIEERNRVIKQLAESNQWSDFIDS